VDSTRYRIELNGAVQGVGFRPFVFRLASTLALNGYVQNSSDGLVIEVEGAADRVAQFIDRLAYERPRTSLVTREDVSSLPLTGASGFVITSTITDGPPRTGMLNDLATCAECLREILDPRDRRYGYPFTNCSACGPRFTITQRLPYDRATTTMRRFEMCDACHDEYDTASDRRHHAQPNACAECGPALSMSIEEVVGMLRGGSIVALKGIGGFHLLCDARNAAVVNRLRSRKARDAKPFAVMMPSLEVTREYCLVNEAEEAALSSPAAPIVLLRPRHPSDLAANVSGPSRLVGVLLPYSPLHHLLMRGYRAPLVATSGNLSGEPLATDNAEARLRLGPIADVVVAHSRTIARPCDDSVVRVGASGPSIIRRARGFAPLPIEVATHLPRALAVGGHLKSTVAIGLDRHAVISQHLGDLETPAARRGFEAAIRDLCRTYAFEPDFVVADRDPDFASRQWADASGLKLLEVQHHHAHVAGCAAENGVARPYLGVAWDGAGLGDDGMVWGGEFLSVDTLGFERPAHLRPFRLPGGDVSGAEGWRVALTMEWATRGDAALEGRDDAAGLAEMLRNGTNGPWCTSVGRLFDAVAAVTGVCQSNRFDGESALALEAAIDPHEQGRYPFGDGLTGDWEPMLDAIRGDLRHGVPVATVAARFHLTLVDWICRVACRLQARDVVLSGDVFQNAFLVDRTVDALRARGHIAHTPCRVPANDGGLSFGQLVLASQCLGTG
jgi:hydrogenase maturation protein HypF